MRGRSAACCGQGQAAPRLCRRGAARRGAGPCEVFGAPALPVSRTSRGRTFSRRYQLPRRAVTSGWELEGTGPPGTTGHRPSREGAPAAGGAPHLPSGPPQICRCREYSPACGQAGSSLVLSVPLLTQGWHLRKVAPTPSAAARSASSCPRCPLPAPPPSSERGGPARAACRPAAVRAGHGGARRKPRGGSDGPGLAQGSPASPLFGSAPGRSREQPWAGSALRERPAWSCGGEVLPAWPSAWRCSGQRWRRRRPARSPAPPWVSPPGAGGGRGGAGSPLRGVTAARVLAGVASAGRGRQVRGSAAPGGSHGPRYLPGRWRAGQGLAPAPPCCQRGSPGAGAAGGTRSPLAPPFPPLRPVDRT